jgi:hypothetical protein
VSAFLSLLLLLSAIVEYSKASAKAIKRAFFFFFCFLVFSAPFGKLALFASERKEKKNVLYEALLM